MPDAPYPAIDALASHITTLSADAQVVLELAPSHVNVLPAHISIGAARQQTCKERVRQISASRPNPAYLDLMDDNPISGEIDNFDNPHHLIAAGAHLIKSLLARLIKDGGFARH